MAESTQIIPFETNGTGLGGNGWSAGIGAFAGSILGDWFGGGYGGWGNRNGTSEAVTDIETGQILDGLSNISNQLSGVNNSILTGQANTNSQLCNGFSGVNTNLYQTSASINSNLANGFNTLNSSINTNGAQTRYDIMSGMNGVQSNLQQASCANLSALNTGFGNVQSSMATGFGNIALNSCQNTGLITSKIGEEGCATRQLIQNNLITDLQNQLWDSKSKVNALETQQYTAGLISAQNTLFDEKLSDMSSFIISQLKTTSSGTTSTT